MFEYKILRSDPDHPYPDYVEDGAGNSWNNLQDALDDLGLESWNLVAGFRKDHIEKVNTEQGLRVESRPDRELLFKRQVNPIRGFWDRLFNR